MKVRRVTRVSDRGVFSGFEWPTTLPELQDRNLIYGWNGAGKSTLAAMFRELETHRDGRVQGDYRFETDNGPISRASAINGGNVWPVRVFNEEFVAESVFTAEGVLPPVLYLGKRSIEAQKLLAGRQVDLIEAKTRLAKAMSDVDSASSQLDRFRVDQARLIKAELRSSGPNEYSNYDKGDFEKRWRELTEDGGFATVLDDPGREKLHARARAVALPPLPELDEAVEVPAEVEARVAAALERSVVSEAISRLADDVDLGSWVEVGLRLHRDRHTESCLFCERPLPGDLLGRLEKHFNDEYSAAVAEIEDLVSRLNDIAVVADLRAPVAEQISPPLSSEYGQALRALEQQRQALKAGVGATIDLLRKKRSSPFSRVAWLPFEPTSLRHELGAMNAVIRAHNDEQAELSSAASKARRELEDDYIAQVAPSLKELDSALAERTSERATIQAELGTIQSEVDRLEAEAVEHRLAADELTRDLADFLGRDELTLELHDAGYRISRRGGEADGLSAGERSGIALLYFLKSLADKSFSRSEGVVVIDDPVSSLDSNAMFGAVGFLKARTEGVGQVLFMTHNFGFFRELRKWLAPRSRKPPFPCSMYLLSCPGTADGRRAELSQLDPLLRDYDSEYQYLFSLVLTGSREPASPNLASLYIYPNVARRLLEAFLAFRLPGASGGLSARLEQVGLPPAKKERLVRFLDFQSHRDGVGIPEDDLSYLAETPAVLRDVIALMRAEDATHFDRMVRAVEGARGE